MKLFGNTSKKKRNDKGYSNTGNRKRTQKETEEIEAQITAYQKKKRRRRIILSSILVVLAVGLFAAYKYIDSPPPVNTGGPRPVQKLADSTDDPDATPTVSNSARRKDGVYTFLIAGTDDGNGLTDTLMVGMLDTVNNTLDVVNIPRDTLVNVSWSSKKVNTILSANKMDVEAFKEGISDIIGYTVDYYAIVDIVAFEKLVDTMGGVYFDVPVNMNYEDPTQNLYIHVSKGYQLLDGKAALGVVRFRSGYVNADIGRIETQQLFLKAVAKQMLQIGNVTKINEFAKIFNDYVDTDMSVKVLAYFGLRFLELGNEDINFQTIPANYDDKVNGVSYVTIYIDTWLEFLNEKLNPYNAEITADMLDILTRDENGKIYATSGAIAGSNPSWGSGYVSASGGSSGGTSGSSGSSGATASATPTPSSDVTPPNIAGDGPVNISDDPAAVSGDPAAGQSPEGSGGTEVTDPSGAAEPPSEADPAGANTEMPPVTDPSASTEAPAVTAPPASAETAAP